MDFKNLSFRDKDHLLIKSSGYLKILFKCFHINSLIGEAVLNIKGRMAFFKGKPILLRWEREEHTYFSFNFGEEKDLVEWAKEKLAEKEGYEYGLISIKLSENLPKRTPIFYAEEFKASFLLGQPVVEVIHKDPMGFENVTLIHVSAGVTILMKRDSFTIYNASKFHNLYLVYKAKGLKAGEGIPPVILKENRVDYNPNALLREVSYSIIRENLYTNVLEELE